MSFRKRFLKDVITLGGYNYSSQVLNFLSSIVLSRLLLPSEYGIVALITVFTGFVLIFTDAGLSYDIIRSNYNRTYHKSIGILALLVGIVLFLLMCILAYPISLIFENIELVLPTIVLSGLFIVKTLSIVPGALLTKDLKFNFIGKIQLFGNLLSITLMIILAYLNFSYWSLIIPQLLSALFVLIFFLRKSGFQMGVPSIKYCVAGFNKVKGIMGNLTGFNMINYWARNADNLIVGKYFGDAALGVYNRAYKMLTFSLSIITGIFGTVLYPSLKRLMDEGGHVQKEYLNILGIISLINYPVALILIIFPVNFVSIMWGQNWLEVAEFLPYFGLMVLSQTLISTTGSVFVLFNKEKTLMFLGFVSSVFIVAAIVLGSFFSVLFIARFYTLAYLVFVIPLNLYYGFYKSFKFYFRQITAFWIPKILISLLILFTIWNNLYNYTFSLMVIYMIHIIYTQRDDIKKVIFFLYAKLFGKV